MKNISLIILLSVLFQLFSCSESDPGYGLCKEGATRCSGDKLEVCSDFEEWGLKLDCSEYGGECISEGNSSKCINLENDGEIPEVDLDFELDDYDRIVGTVEEELL